MGTLCQNLTFTISFQKVQITAGYFGGRDRVSQENKSSYSLSNAMISKVLYDFSSIPSARLRYFEIVIGIPISDTSVTVN